MERARLVEPVILLLGPKWIDRHPVETAHPNRLLPPRTVMGIPWRRPNLITTAIVRDLRDQRGIAIDHPVPDSAGVLVRGVGWADQPPVGGWPSEATSLLDGSRVVLLGISDGSIHCGRVVGSVEPDPERFSDR